MRQGWLLAVGIVGAGGAFPANLATSCSCQIRRRRQRRVFPLLFTTINFTRDNVKTTCFVQYNRAVILRCRCLPDPTLWRFNCHGMPPETSAEPAETVPRQAPPVYTTLPPPARCLLCLFGMKPLLILRCLAHLEQPRLC